MEQIIILASVLALFTTGLLQVVKSTFNVNKRFLPLASIVAGVVVGALATFIDADLNLRLWAGVGAGLSAVGLFEVSKNIKSGE